MPVAVTNHNDEEDRRNQPPKKKPVIFSISRLRDEQTEQRHEGKNRRETRNQSLLRNMRVPRKTLDSNPTGAEEVMRIEFVRDLVSVPIPDARRHERDRGEESEPL